MGEAGSGKVAGGFDLDERERRFAEMVRDVLLEHIEHRLPLKVWTAEDPAKEGWTWALARDYFEDWHPGSWVHSVFVHTDGKIDVEWGHCDVDDLISEEHPRFCYNLCKKSGVEALRKIVEDLQDRNNWGRYERKIPKVVRYFRDCLRIAEEVSAKHGVDVEFWMNTDRCGVHAIVDTVGMDEDQKLAAIIKAATALRDFNDRLYSEA